MGARENGEHKTGAEMLHFHMSAKWTVRIEILCLATSNAVD